MTKSQDIVIKELKELFDVDNNLELGTYCIGAKFAISKKQMERFDVIDTLGRFFDDVEIEGGYIKVTPITFIHTVFEVCNGKPY